ncbi:hypothetical protein SHAQ108633_02075 [Shewanella aquimarina]
MGNRFCELNGYTKHLFGSLGDNYEPYKLI